MTSPTGERVGEPSLASLEGTSVAGDGSEIPVVLQQNELYAGQLDFDHQRRQFEAITLEITLTRIGKHHFMFVSTTSGDYYFAQLLYISPDKVEVRPPDKDIFERAIADGELATQPVQSPQKGNVKSRLVIVADENAFSALINRHGIDTCFPVRDAITYCKKNPKLKD